MARDYVCRFCGTSGHNVSSCPLAADVWAVFNLPREASLAAKRQRLAEIKDVIRARFGMDVFAGINSIFMCEANNMPLLKGDRIGVEKRCGLCGEVGHRSTGCPNQDHLRLKRAMGIDDVNVRDLNVLPDMEWFHAHLDAMEDSFAKLEKKFSIVLPRPDLDETFDTIKEKLDEAYARLEAKKKHEQALKIAEELQKTLANLQASGLDISQIDIAGTLAQNNN